MPLKLIKRGRIFYVRGTVAGTRAFESTGTDDRARAEAYRAKREAELWDRRIYGERAVVTFAEAALSYIEARAPSASEKFYIRRLADHFGTAKLVSITQAAVDRAYAEILKPGAAPATRARGVLSPLCAILNHAARRGWCDRPAFERPRLPAGKTRWLTPAEALILESHAAPHLRPLIRFILCTGARLAEAIELDWSAVDLPAARAMFWVTKGGRPRAASLPPEAIVVLANLPGGREGRVFRRPDGQPYADRHRAMGGQIRTAFGTACRRAGVEATPHDLRHTWATWFYAVTKDPFLLRDEGGWQSVRMVERYAHLMRSELVAGVADVWGPSHPRIGALPGAKSAQSSRRA